MAKFSHTLRLAINHRGHWVTSELTFHELDTDIPIAEQLANVDDSVSTTFDYIRNKLDVQLGDVMELMDKS